jgi:hypothetical protein
MTNPNEHEEVDTYGDTQITSLHNDAPKWLKWLYVLLPIWGIIWFYMFWNGSTVPFFDRGYWHQLQEAANTTFPSINQDDK